VVAVGDALPLFATAPENPVGLARTPSGNGWWAAGSDGSVSRAGDAGAFGDLLGVAGRRPTVGMAARPNGQEGWVRASDVTVAAHQFHGELTLSDFTLRMWNGDELIAETQVVIGTDSTPTPVGRLYISEKIPQSYAGGAYGPWVLATSAYSEALDLFDGGLPVIAFHGTNNPGLIGSKASNGCIRMPNDVVTMLAETLPAGTPVDVRA
jgi:hypothetical protein